MPKSRKRTFFLDPSLQGANVYPKRSAGLYIFKVEIHAQMLLTYGFMS